MKDEILFIQISKTELQFMLEEAVKNAVLNLHSLKQKHEEYLTRKEVAELFKVSLTTVNDWCKIGKIKRHHINSRVYFLKSELDQIFQTSVKSLKAI